ncbi:uncharacterized protein LAESUDRAFT_72032 [Laetiporus sulphureus 93-53]|uniref:Uncharacterized protein n=1 Tax=Laetiporus sulphureus 93-53 TaxID=1314785 RepID=A0A165AVU3_9APHY|nr:uncharacterized protein LAESUDRAFT_72032 [Laetiporus sulphureus 93-53]KZS99761.1 hypothetical protein LAESUDRAFT_72032 [Laetiporus sulphureus 93-53]
MLFRCTDADTRSSAELIVLFHGSEHVLLPLPETYEDAIKTAQQEFSLDGELCLVTHGLAGCAGQKVRIHADAWEGIRRVLASVSVETRTTSSRTSSNTLTSTAAESASRVITHEHGARPSPRVLSEGRNRRLSRLSLVSNSGFAPASALLGKLDLDVSLSATNVEDEDEEEEVRGVIASPSKSKGTSRGSVYSEEEDEEEDEFQDEHSTPEKEKKAQNAASKQYNLQDESKGAEKDKKALKATPRRDKLQEEPDIVIKKEANNTVSKRANPSPNWAEALFVDESKRPLSSSVRQLKLSSLATPKRNHAFESQLKFTHTPRTPFRSPVKLSALTSAVAANGTSNQGVKPISNRPIDSPTRSKKGPTPLTPQPQTTAPTPNPAEDRFVVSIEYDDGTSGIQACQFKTRARHTVGKVLMQACRTFGIEHLYDRYAPFPPTHNHSACSYCSGLIIVGWLGRARMVLVVETGEDEDFMLHRYVCAKEDTMARAGAEMDSRFVLEVDGDEVDE